jgi:hypothetical protein
MRAHRRSVVLIASLVLGLAGAGLVALSPGATADSTTTDSSSGTAFAPSARPALIKAAKQQAATATPPVVDVPTSGAASICPAPAPGEVRCMGAVAAPSGNLATPGSGGTAGYSAALLQQAYGVSGYDANGEVVAIVDAYDDPNAETSLGDYRSQNSLPPCTTANGCFTKISQRGSGAAADLPCSATDTRVTCSSADKNLANAWSGEIELDLAAVSAICPGCKILLVESDTSGGDMYTAVQQAVVYQHAHYVSMSWGGPEWSGELDADTAFFSSSAAAGVTFVASSGDCGYYDTPAGAVEYPASSPNVVAAGGVTLNYNGTTFSYSAWGNTNGGNANSSCTGGSVVTPPTWAGAGSGCSGYVSQPVWQSGVTTPCAGKRAYADVSAIADPYQGILMPDGYLWGGTSLAAPVLASLYALTHERIGSNHPASADPTTSVQAYAYAHASGLQDVTTGANFPDNPAIDPTFSITNNCTFSGLDNLCRSRAGWDGPTGVGTPASPAALYAEAPSPSPSSSASPSTSSSEPSPSGSASPSATPSPSTSPTAPAPPSAAPIPNPGAVTTYTGVAANIDLTGATSVTGLPPGTNFSGGHIVGLPSQAGSYVVTASADGVSPVSFTWTVTQNAFKPRSTPTITGTPKRNRTVKVAALSWNSLDGAKATPKITYQWFLNGKALKGATASSYKIPNKRSFAKKTLRVRIVIKVSSYYSAYSVTTKPTKKIR